MGMMLERKTTRENRTAGGQESPQQLCGWQVDRERNRLVGNDRAIAVEPRVMQTLQVLLARPGQTIRREELTRSIWGHTHVTEDALTRCVALLRKALAEIPAPRPQVETIPRVGYALHLPRRPHRPVSRRRLAWIGSVLAAAVVAVALLSGRSTTPTSLPRSAPLTSLAGIEIEPSFAPDSKRLVYAHRTEDHDWQLLVQALSDGEPRVLDTGPGKKVAPRWSPDGRHIAFLRFHGGGCAVMHVAVAGGRARHLARCDPRSDHSLSWTPNGSGLIFTPPQVGGRGLARLDLETLDYTLITRPSPAEIGDADPAVSPNGRRLAFTRWHDYGVGDVFIADLDGGEPLRLTNDGVKVHGLAWDGNALVFASNRGGSFGLWRIDAAGGEPVPVPISGRDIDTPVISPDGRRLVYEEWLDQSDVLRVPLTGGDGEKAVASSRWDWGARLSPGGDRLAFLSDRSGSPELWVSQADGSGARPLTDNGGAYISEPVWSPDGRTLVFEAAVTGHFDLYQVPAAGGPVKRLTRDPGSDRYAHWLADGRRLLFGSTRSGEWQIWQLDVETGALEQVTSGGGSVARLDGDSGWLYVSHCREGALWRQRPGSGSEALYPGLAPIDCANWQLVGEAVYLVAREPNSWQPSLARLDPRTLEVRILRSLEDFKYGAGFEVIGDSLLYTRIRQNQVDLMMVPWRQPGG